jgi:hypothetical protein
MSRPPLALIVGALALVAWGVAAILVPTLALRGWAIGFVAVSCPMLGSLAAVLIHRLTGGGWGEAFAPRLLPAARATPLLCLYILPLLAGAPLIYAWAAAPAGLDAQTHRLFLNLPLFVLRAAIAVLGWSAIALNLDRILGPNGRLGAGLGLAFHGIAVSVVAIDWVLSVQPAWTSSDFGMELAVMQLASAFAWAGLAPGLARSNRDLGDLIGLLFATLLGLTYLEFVSFLVVWYGDRPTLDSWYLLRARPPWQAPVWIALGLDLVAVALTIWRRAIGVRRALRLISLTVLAGLVSYQLWLLLPALGAACLPFAALALIGMGGIWIAALDRPPFGRRPTELAHAR